MTTDIAALIAEADAVTFREIQANPSKAESLIERLSDALESLTAPATDDEEDPWALSSFLFSVYDHGTNPNAVGEAGAILAFLHGRGFRRSARVPVSQDELRRIVLKQLERKDSIARAARSTVIVDALTATHDIFPKADRKSADSSNGDDQ